MYISTIRHLGMVQVVGSFNELTLMVTALSAMENFKAHIAIRTDEKTIADDTCVLVCRTKRYPGYNIVGDIYRMESPLKEWRRYNKNIEVKPQNLSDRRSVWRYIDSKITKMLREVKNA